MAINDCALRWRQFALPLSLVLICLLLQFFEPDSSLWLRYERNLIIDGAWWRLISGNFVHISWEHNLMNLAGLILIWLLFGRLLSQVHWLMVLLTGSMAVGLGLLLFNPNLDWYVGLSGTLHGLFITGLILNIRRGFRLEWLLLIGLSLKLVWEQIYGGLPGTSDLAGGTVIVDAHLYGAVSGLLISFLLYFKKNQPRTTH